MNFEVRANILEEIILPFAEAVSITLGDAPNYVEMILQSKEDPNASFVLTMMRKSGKSPREMADEARLEAGRLRCLLEEANKRLLEIDVTLNQENHSLLGWHLNGNPEPISNFFENHAWGPVEPGGEAVKGERLSSSAVDV